LTVTRITVIITVVAENAPEFDVAELAQLARVTPRTIYYYAQQGLIPPAAGTGPGPKYGRGHLARIRLIKRLQREHLPLAEIARRLKALSDEQVEQLLQEGRSDPPQGASALEYVRSVLAKSGQRQDGSRLAIQRRAIPNALMPRQLTARSVDQPSADSQPSIAALREESHAEAETIWAVATAPSGPGERSQWERITLADGLELHVRRPLTRIQQKALERLMIVAREVLEEPDE
jgi:DNA-binding transcriptional MerR regulator